MKPIKGKRAAPKSSDNTKRRIVRPEELIDATLRELRNPASRFYGVPRDMFDFYMTNLYLAPRCHIAGPTNASSAQPQTTFIEHPIGAEDACVLPNGDVCWVYVGSERRLDPVKISLLINGKLIYQIQTNHTNTSARICVTANENVAICDVHGCCVYIVSVAREQLIRKFGSMGSAPGQLQHPYDIALDNDGNLVACDGDNRRLQVFTEDGTFVRTISCGGIPEIVAVHPVTGNYHVNNYRQRDIRTFDRCTGSEISRFDAYPLNVYVTCRPSTITFDADGNLFVSYYQDPALRCETPDHQIHSWVDPESKRPAVAVIDSHGRVILRNGQVFTWTPTENNKKSPTSV